MTNAEYEKLCVDSARKTTREVAEQAVANLDDKIKDAEKALALPHEARRELVNRYDLNRCSHRYEIRYREDLTGYLHRQQCDKVLKYGEFDE